MPRHELGDRLRDKLAELFVTRHERSDGILFHGPDPKQRGKLLRLLITSEAWEDYTAELPAAVDRAIALLREQGGNWVLRLGRSLDRLEVVQESVEETQ